MKLPIASALVVSLPIILTAINAEGVATTEDVPIDTSYFAQLTRFAYGTPEPEVRWKRTRLNLRQDQDDYVVIFFPVELADQFESAFVEAAQFWNDVLGQDQAAPDLVFNQDTSINNAVAACNTGEDFVVPGGTTLRGLAILAEITEIDGPGRVLGSAGPCLTRRASNGQNFPRIGRMRFDVVDVQGLVNNGSFNNVIKHEMGHVIGIGTLWRNLVANPCDLTNADCGGDPNFLGANALAAFNSLGGTGQLDVANTGGAGTANAHWRESTFRNELMTGFLNNGNNPVSIITLRSLQDIGYIVNLDLADAFQIPGVPLPDGGTDTDTGSNDGTGTDTDDGTDLGGDTNPNAPVGTESDLKERLKNSGQTVIIGIAVVSVLLIFAVAVFVSKRANKRSSADRSMAGPPPGYGQQQFVATPYSMKMQAYQQPQQGYNSYQQKNGYNL